MFHFLLTIEHLAVLLLFWTWLIAATAHRSWRLRLPVLGVVLLLLLGWTGLLAGGWIFLATLYPPLRATAIATPLLLFVGFLIGSVAIWIRGRRSADHQFGASDWPTRRIALVLAIAVGVHFVTWANLDAAVQKEITALRAEAYHMAASVAPVQVSDRENAAPIYQEIFDAWGAGEWSKAWPNWNEWNFEKIDVQSKEVQEFLAARRHFVDRLRQAAVIPQCRFEHEYYRPAPDIILPEIQSMRDASRLLSLDAMSHFAAGRIEEAIKDLDAMWSIADHAASQPFLVSLLVGLGIEKSAISTLEWGMGQGDWKGRKLPMLAMEKGGMAARLRLHRALAFEECMGILMCCDAAQGQGILWDPYLGLGNPGAGYAFTAAYRVFPFFAQDVALYRQKMRKLRQNAETLPVRPFLKEIKADADEPQALGLIPRYVVPMGHALRNALQAEIPRETVRLGVQAFRYELKHGKSPAKLDDLIPEFIAVVPRDPFSKETYRFIPAKDGQPWIVYSIGTDGIDNGGSRIEAGDSGDIVVSPRRKKE